MHSQDTLPYPSANRESVFMRAVNSYMTNINQNLPQSALIQSTVFWLTVYLTLYVLFTFAVFGVSSLNDVVIQPPPSAGWRRAQSLTCIAGHFVILNSVLVWFIAKSLKGLQVINPAPQHRSPKSPKAKRASIKDNIPIIEASIAVAQPHVTQSLD
ncbi:hypothetical protein BC831DRAFT_451866 [Entophlyctis helioformis]|nr:hypothetical protein BC831DRAFT_451866 [Entophlyctis helioformis]